MVTHPQRTDPQAYFSVSPAADAYVFFEMLNLPICTTLLWPDPAAAKQCPRADIRLAFYPKSGFIGNIEFDATRLEYTQAYENALDFSPRFQQYAHSLAICLIERHQLHHKRIIEIGCGKGDFLLLLCQLGDNQGVGFDPSYVARPMPENLNRQVEFIQDYYSERYAHYQGDFIVCRHTLEHLPDPMQFLKTLRRSIGNRQNTKLFFEVPNALHTFRNLAVWDIIYEHCCYFSPASLAYLFELCGFEVLQVTEVYEGQFLCVEAMPAAIQETLSPQQQDEISQLAADVAVFTANFQAKVDTWSNQLRKIASQGKRAVVWGAGAKGNTFLNILAASNSVDYVVDINPRKHGLYVAGTAQQIVPPDFLRTYRPEVILIMNQIYKDEIDQLIHELEFEAKLLCA